MFFEKLPLSRAVKHYYSTINIRISAVCSCSMDARGFEYGEGGTRAAYVCTGSVQVNIAGDCCTRQNVFINNGLGRLNISVHPTFPSSRHQLSNGREKNRTSQLSANMSTVNKSVSRTFYFFRKKWPVL